MVEDNTGEGATAASGPDRGRVGPLAGTLYSDPLSGPGGPAPDDLSMMRPNAQAITAALSE